MTKNPLQERALLVHCTICQFQNKRTSQKAIDRIRTFTRTQPGDTFIKTLFDPKAVIAINQKARALRKVVNEATLPWLAGMRLLPAENLFDFQRDFNTAKQEFESLVITMSENVDKWLEDQRKELGDDFDGSIYPESAAAFREACYATISLMPVPDADDFRLTIPEEIVGEIREKAEAQWNAEFTDERLTHLETLMDAYDTDPTTRKLVAIKAVMKRLNGVYSILSDEQKQMMDKAKNLHYI